MATAKQTQSRVAGKPISKGNATRKDEFSRAAFYHECRMDKWAVIGQELHRSD